jgi:hypothetical protein
LRKSRSKWIGRLKVNTDFRPQRQNWRQKDGKKRWKMIRKSSKKGPKCEKKALCQSVESKKWAKKIENEWKLLEKVRKSLQKIWPGMKSEKMWKNERKWTPKDPENVCSAKLYTDQGKRGLPPAPFWTATPQVRAKMGPKWVKMRIGRGGENGDKNRKNWDQKMQKLGPENRKNGAENQKKWVWGEQGRRGGEGKMGRKRIVNMRK